jgi:hypothetical protein
VAFKLKILFQHLVISYFEAFLSDNIYLAGLQNDTLEGLLILFGYRVFTFDDSVPFGWCREL